MMPLCHHIDDEEFVGPSTGPHDVFKVLKVLKAPKVFKGLKARYASSWGCLVASR